MLKPEWLKVSVNLTKFKQVENLIDRLNLNVVCYHASCPNIGQCFAKSTATFLILGENCTRNCKFCSIKKGEPTPPDPNEPENVAQAVKELNITHAVITSVTRDDLADFGASHFVQTVQAIRRLPKRVIIELLIPDFNGSPGSLKNVVQSNPEIINHNLETVPCLYPSVRPEANYERSLKILERIKTLSSNIYTKSGLMVGLGETEDDVISVMKDLRVVNCDILTIGQYLQPSKDQLEVVDYIHPDTFKKFKSIGERMGFLYVNSGPFVRSSFNAEEFSQRFISES